MKSTAANVAAMIEALKANGVPVAEISRTAGIGRKCLWRLANCEIQKPSYDVVTKIAALHERKINVQRG